ncbi:MAG: YraN family protein [Patescibacteria group bacterium]
MTKKSEIGEKGENYACTYLENKSYKILNRNYREVFGELDIIALAPDKTLVFVEVKTMTGSGGFLRPEDQMTAAKLKKFRRVAQFYAGKHEELINDKKGWRLDLVAILITDGKPEISHYENVA